MAATYAVDGGANIVRITLRGAVTSEDFDALFAAAEQDAAFHRHLHRLVDATDATSFPSSEAIRHVADRVRARGVSDESRIAVAARSGLAAGIMAMILGGAGLSGQYEMFDDVTAAEAWLGSQSETAWREFLERTEGRSRPRPGQVGTGRAPLKGDRGRTSTPG